MTLGVILGLLGVFWGWRAMSANRPVVAERSPDRIVAEFVSKDGKTRKSLTLAQVRQFEEVGEAVFKDPETGVTGLLNRMGSDSVIAP